MIKKARKNYYKPTGRTVGKPKTLQEPEIVSLIERCHKIIGVLRERYTKNYILYLFETYGMNDISFTVSDLYYKIINKKYMERKVYGKLIEKLQSFSENIESELVKHSEKEIKLIRGIK